MWYPKILSIILVCLVFVTIVQGSCLEYGHSCWGAHGKRSGGGKIYHGDTNLQSGGELNFLTEVSANKNNDDNAAVHKPLIEKFDNLNTIAENSAHPTSNEDTHEFNENAAKLKNLLRKRNSRFRPGRSQLNPNDLSTEQRSEHKETRHDPHGVAAERWRKIPLFHLKSFAKTPLNAVAAAENDLLHQLERQEAAAADEEAGDGVFYDFQ